MLSFIRSFDKNADALAIFVNEKYGFKEKKGILTKDIAQKLNSHIDSLKGKNEESEITSFDISAKKKMFCNKNKTKIF